MLDPFFAEYKPNWHRVHDDDEAPNDPEGHSEHDEDAAVLEKAPINNLQNFLNQNSKPKNKK